MNRHTQDLLWLQRLRAEGVERLLPQPSPPPKIFFKGLDQFNRGAYWQSHESLEEVWLETAYPLKLFYYGLIKVAVGFVHIQRHNQRGAGLQLRVAVSNLEPFLPTFLSVQTGPLRQESQAWLERLSAPSVSWEELDGLPRPKILLAVQ